MKTRLFLFLSAMLMWCTAAFAQEAAITAPEAGVAYSIVHSIGLFPGGD